MPWTIAIAVATTQIRACLLNTDYVPTEEYKYPPLLAFQSNEYNFADLHLHIANAIDEIVDIAKRVNTARLTDAKNPQLKDVDIRGIGISIIGGIDSATGNYIPTHHANFLNPVVFRAPLRAKLQGAFGDGIKVAIGNRSNMAAVGELKWGWGAENKAIHHLIFVSVSANIGAGIIVHEELYKGTRGLAGVLGHIVVDRTGPICLSCKQPGCLTMMASGRAMLKEAVPLLEQGSGIEIQNAMLGRGEEQPLYYDEGGNELINSRTANVSKIDARSIIQAAENNDAEALAIVNKAGGFMGRSVVQMMNFLNPDAIIFGGIVYSSFAFLAAATAEAQPPRIHAITRGACQVNLSLLEDKAELYGAAQWTYRQG